MVSDFTRSCNIFQLACHIFHPSSIWSLNSSVMPGFVEVEGLASPYDLVLAVPFFATFILAAFYSHDKPIM